MKLVFYVDREVILRRTPCGVRGLKLRLPCMRLYRSMSHPVWGAWIETGIIIPMQLEALSHPVWGAWIETRPR